MSIAPRILFFTLALFISIIPKGYAALTLMEDQTVIANGNGISTPSFWQGLSGQNPAGMAFNSNVKAQGTVAVFNSDFKSPKSSGALLAGNSLIGAGAEWSKYSTQPTSGGVSLANWGIAGRIAPIHMTLGFSGHYPIPTGLPTYDFGTLIDFGRSLRVGAMITDFSHGLRVVGGGFNFMLTNRIDLVVDGAYRIQNKYGIVKPGLGFHLGFLQASASYGVRLFGQGDLFVGRFFTGALGLVLTRFLLIQYEYQGLVQHRLGLTLRWN